MSQKKVKPWCLYIALGGVPGWYLAGEFTDRQVALTQLEDAKNLPMVVAAEIVECVIGCPAERLEW